LAILSNHGSKGMSSSFKEDSAIKKLLIFICMLAGPAMAQSANETVVRFTGFLGNLQFTVQDVRADLVDANDDVARVAIKMNEEATSEFFRFTTTHVGQSVVFSVCGEQMERLTVAAPIDTGFALTDVMDLDRAEEIVTAFNDEGPCPN